ncbi:NAD(P)-dependent oxidoreductase [Limnobacter sp.]|uniref:NAD(P)-dependent oxidoreductase n=1 Tax=Limnobacter sp. TaxID=2003368 RepID=UPI002585BF18|nr:NAD(P)-dependent oxidoreductase [Limnobacter sp.]
MAPQTIGFIGLGNMGGAMVRRLCAAGHIVHTWSRNPDRYAPLADLPLVRHDSPADLAQSCTLIFTNVTATADVHSLLFDARSGLALHARAGSIIADFSTIDADATKAMSRKLLEERAVHLLDCPVSGGSKGAQAGTLSIMVGGELSAFEHIQPLLQSLGTTVEHVGPSGAGQAIKAANQMAMCIQLAGIAEAFAYAQKQGADPVKVLKLLQAGLAGSKVLDWAGPHIASGFSGKPDIEARLHHKDLHMISEAAQLQGLNLPLLTHTAELLDALMSQGGAHRDTSEIFKIVQSQMS